MTCEHSKELLDAVNDSIEVLIEQTVVTHVHCLMNELCDNCTAELLAEVYTRPIFALTKDISVRTMKAHDVVAAVFIERVAALVRHELSDANERSVPSSKAIN